MSKLQSSIHRSLDDDAMIDTIRTVVPERIARLATLDQRLLSGNLRSLGPGGASAAYSNAVQKALVDEMADQLRAGPGTYGAVATAELKKRGKLSDIAQWAAEIVAAFEEKA
jgi:hypothetical protein